MGNSRVNVSLWVHSLISLIRDITTTTLHSTQGTIEIYETHSICFNICRAHRSLILFRMNIPFE